MEILVEIIAYVVRPTSSASVCERQISNFFSAILCQFCDFGLRRKLLLEVSVTVPLVFTWEKNMHLVLSRGFVPLVIGATLLAGGCATKDDVRAAQATADAARMQALDARSAADMAFAAAQSAGQRADQANSTAQQAQQTANNAQSAADNAQASAQNAAATAQQAKDDVRAAEERTQQAERNRRVRNTRLARGERG
jgi:hypothetical protein